MTIQQLTWQQVQTHLEQAEDCFAKSSTTVNNVLFLQPRLSSVIEQFCPEQRQAYDAHFMMLKATEGNTMLSLLCEAIKSKLPNLSDSSQYPTYNYHINNNKVTLNNSPGLFSATDNCLYAEWVNAESLFGGVRQPENGDIILQPGLVHKANGGVLILGLRALLSQPLLWIRLKQIVTSKEFQWLSNDEGAMLPISIPSMPIDLRIVLVGDRESLSMMQEFEPELFYTSSYAEFESFLSITSTQSWIDWAGYLQFMARHQQLPSIDASAYSEIIKVATRYTEDQLSVPLIPDWFSQILSNAAKVNQHSVIDQHSIIKAEQKKNWQESYLTDHFLNDIISQQVKINTKDKIVGQINGLSVIEYPGHPKLIGEPARITCLIHFGDGELSDIEQKSELAGNIHTKGMMILNAFIMSEFALDHQLPFTSSIVFEQSYNEIDGDSASLAGLCVLISSLAGQPIDQQLAVTGSVDQFGFVQPIGGVNEKIESFYNICKHQGLTGLQGVVIPKANMRHLCLNDEIREAIKNEQFSIWAVEHVSEALLLLTGTPYKDDKPINLYTLIQTRIQQTLMLEKKSKNRFLRWFN